MKSALSLLWLLIAAIFTCPQPVLAGPAKRVAVLYFEDHSHFDSPTGCGLIPSGPFKFLFGKGDTSRQTWYLAAGFRDLLNQTLKDTGVYEPVGYEELGVALAELQLSRRDLRSESNRARLADRLKVDALITGDIKKFGQERLRGSTSRDIQIVQGQMAAATVYGIAGFLYRAYATVDLMIYDGGSGKQVVTTQISESATHEGGAVAAGPIRTDVTKAGFEAKLTPAEKEKKSQKAPIVDYKKLNKVRFGNYTPLQPGEEEVKFEDTLFGIATKKAMDKVVARLREEVGPELALTEPAPVPEFIRGKIIYLSNNASDPEAYINLGSSGGIKRGMKIPVFAIGEELKDPDTGVVLGNVEFRVGMLEISEVQTEGLSIAKIIEGADKIKLHDVVKGSK